MSRYFVQKVYGKRFSGVNPQQQQQLQYLLIWVPIECLVSCVWLLFWWYVRINFKMQLLLNTNENALTIKQCLEVIFMQNLDEMYFRNHFLSQNVKQFRGRIDMQLRVIVLF